MDTADDEHWMRMALEQATRALALDEVPVGAVLVRDGELLAAGHNQVVTQHDPSAHAEVLTLRAAGLAVENYRLPNTVLYVSLEPCAMCVGAIVHARVQRVVFGAHEPKAGCLISNTALLDNGHFNHRFEIQGGVLGAECSALISGFFAAKRS